MKQVTSRKCMLIWVVQVIALLALLGTGTVINADEVSQICVNPSGLTRIVGANGKCLPSEKLFDLSQGGAATVIDSLGKTVGPLVQSDLVALTVGGDRFLVGVGPGGFRNTAGLTLFYEGLGCSGLALIQPSTNLLLPLLRVAPPTGYYGGREFQIYSILPSRKSYNSNLGAFDPCNNFPSFGQQMTPAKTLNLPAFTPPFSVK